MRKFLEPGLGILPGVLVVLGMFAGLPGASAENPLGFREYRQQLTLTFATSEAAREAELTPRALPAPYHLAFSARWDDTSLNHLKTESIMAAHGVKGTFFLNNPGSNFLTKAPQYCRDLMKNGSSIGLHTVTHPMLTLWNSNEHFREFMFNRIQLETIAQTPINSQVLPYCNWQAPLPAISESVGWGMRAAGVISSPDVFYPDRARELGYPDKTHATSRLLTPGDRNPDLAKLEKQLADGLKNTAALAIQPSISMSMHSWHTPEGLVNLDLAFKRLAKQPGWWYCNQNEYGAYRYEALNARIEKQVKGNEAIFTVTRMEPFELGASVPLDLTLKGAAPVAVAGGRWHDGVVTLPHATGHALPVQFARAEADGSSVAMPFARLTLTHPSENRWRARLENTGDVPLEALAFTFRFPPSCGRETIRVDRGAVAPGATVEVDATQTLRREELLYRYGQPYYAVQLDFVRDGKPCRLYADLREPAATGLPLMINQAAAIYEWDGKVDLAALSKPAASPEALGLRAANPPQRGEVGAGAVYPLLDRRAWQGKSYLAIVEFVPVKPGELEFRSFAGDSGKRSELWLNGSPIVLHRNQAMLKPVAGVNRLILKSPADRGFLLLFNGEKEPCVTFQPIR